MFAQRYVSATTLYVSTAVLLGRGKSRAAQQTHRGCVTRTPSLSQPTLKLSKGCQIHALTVTPECIDGQSRCRGVSKNKPFRRTTSRGPQRSIQSATGPLKAWQVDAVLVGTSAPKTMQRHHLPKTPHPHPVHVHWQQPPPDQSTYVYACTTHMAKIKVLY